MRFIPFLFLFVSLTAYAGDWGVLDGATCNTSPAKNTMAAGDIRCHDPSSSSDDTAILDVSACESFDVWNFADKDGDSTACTVAWTFQHCPSEKGSLTATAEDAACYDASEISAIAADDGEVNLGGTYVRFTGDGAGSNATDCRLLAKCVQRSNQ